MQASQTILRSERGSMIVEAVIAGVILMISMFAAITVYQRNLLQMQVAQVGDASTQIEDQVKTYVFQAVRQYWYNSALTGGCVDGNLPPTSRFAAMWSHPTPAGINFALLSPTTAAALATQTQPTDGKALTPEVGAYQSALARCQNQSDVNGLNGSSRLYFCLQLSPASGTPLHDQLMSMQPLFAEFNFQPMDITTASPITCSGYGLYGTPGQEQSATVLGVLYYTFYWSSHAASGNQTMQIYKHFTNTLALEGALRCGDTNSGC